MRARTRWQFFFLFLGFVFVTISLFSDHLNAIISHRHQLDHTFSERSADVAGTGHREGDGGIDMAVKHTDMVALHRHLHEHAEKIGRALAKVCRRGCGVIGLCFVGTALLCC